MSLDQPQDARNLADRSPMSPSWRTMVSVTLAYLACLAVATWPAMSTMRTELPSRVDPLAHIWTMRWNKSCLMQGRLPFVCPDVQYPVGAALGTLPPMHFQTLLYIPLSFLFNDILCYNLIRTFAFLLTGVGTFLLIWNVLQSRAAAFLGGLTAMIGTPMMFFSHGELEQITVGWFPIFLIAWLRWVDRPTVRGLVASATLYAFVAMSAPYYGVFAIFPATLYVVWRGLGAGWSEAWPWLRGRLAWFMGFGAICLPVLVVLFSNQIWALKHGFSMARPEAEFAMLRAPFWGYLVPAPHLWLASWLPFDTNVMQNEGSVPSYLGVVTLALITYAALTRARFARGSYWWAVFVVLLVLSLGAHTLVAGYDISLPAGWLKKHFIGFRMIRVPARFSLFAAVGAAVVAGAGLKHLLGRLPGNRSRLAIFSALSIVALLDLSASPYATIGIPPMPACYEVIRRRDPTATFLDAPQFNSGAFLLPSICSYWQSLHGGKTSAGYTAFGNARYDNLLYYNSPFDAFKLRQPDYLANPQAETFEFEQRADFRSYVWLYLNVYNLRYVVVHHQAAAFPEFPVYLDRMKDLLKDAKIFEDADTAVFDRDLLPRPTRPVFLYAEGWGHRVARWGRRVCMVGDSAKLHVYNPTPEQPLTFTLDAASHKSSRAVALKRDSQELARWQVGGKVETLLASPAFRLPEGLSTLTLASEGAEPPSRSDVNVEGDRTPFSLWVTGVGLEPSTDRAIAGRSLDGVVR